jgi:hypothetical protein
MVRKISVVGVAVGHLAFSLPDMAPPPVGNEGYAATREQAMAAFKARWLQSRDPARVG